MRQAPVPDISVIPESDGDPAHFVQWARTHLSRLSTLAADPPWDDLSDLGKMIGSATVVALGEGLHGMAEPLEFRNRLLRYLVEEKGFTAIAIESGIVESRIVHNYVRGGGGALNTVASEGMSWNFGALTHNHALIEWLRQYNAAPDRPRKINFYGFDVPGSPGDPNARRSLDTALVAALHFLTAADAGAAADFAARVGRLLPFLRFDYYGQLDGPSYNQLTSGERDALTAAIADLVALLERHEARYISAGSPSDYEWAHRAAIAARQLDGWLRQIPLQWRASVEDLTLLDRAADLRDRAQADNLDWIIKREGPQGKVLVFAHNAHLSLTSIRRTWWPLNPPAALQQTVSLQQEVAGTYLRRRYGADLFTLGHLVGHRKMPRDGTGSAVQHAPADSADGLFREAGVPMYLLDLRAAPPRVASWLEKERQTGPGFELPGRFRGRIELAVGKAFDAIWYLDAVTVAQTATSAAADLP